MTEDLLNEFEEKEITTWDEIYMIGATPIILPVVGVFIVIDEIIKLIFGYKIKTT